MINRRQWILLSGAAGAMPLLGKFSGAFADDDSKVRAAVDAAVKPVIAQYQIPGMAVGVTIDGARSFVEYGRAAKKPDVAVTRETLFELGSISKTFTATLATMAVGEGKLSLSDAVGRHLPELKDSPIGQARLLDLGTHTGGGFPLQIPDRVKTDAQLMDWYRAWKPKYAAGSTRTYANPSIALLGIVTARAMGQDFATLAEQKLFPALGLTRTYINVPAAEMPSYAWGTNAAGKAVRVGPSPIATEAYGVKSNTTDMLRVLEVNMGVAADVAAPVARAVAATHAGYYQTGPFIQDLVWEQYTMAAKLEDMMAGNGPTVSYHPIPATAIEPPMPPRDDVILNKTGSTGGFGAYVFCAPAKKFGIVLLANKGYPNEVRTKAAWEVMAGVVG